MDGCQYHKKRFTVGPERFSKGKKCLKDCANEGVLCDDCRPIAWNHFQERRTEEKTMS